MPNLIKTNSVKHVEPSHFPTLEEFLKDPAAEVKISPDDDIALLADHLDGLAVVAFEFTNFMDGRSFSQARLLRDNYEFKGEIRATGGFIQDQLYYLARCGFDAFELADSIDIDSAQQSLKDFSENYQAAFDISEPLFRRRA
jgi:uncharacterized protein (DUF934 family)